MFATVYLINQLFSNLNTPFFLWVNLNTPLISWFDDVCWSIIPVIPSLSSLSRSVEVKEKKGLFLARCTPLRTVLLARSLGRRHLPACQSLRLSAPRRQPALRALALRSHRRPARF